MTLGDGIPKSPRLDLSNNTNNTINMNLNVKCEKFDSMTSGTSSA